ncbi:Urb2/Npa2 family-domain-containing protein, partial [Rhodocollybia butyracea]
MDSFLSSSQNFVRALKASSDPPNPAGPSKVEIARAAWDQRSFYAPRKAEVIVDLVLQRFLKNSEASITDVPSWQLLLDVISSQTLNHDSWLGPLVSRIHFTRILIQLFGSIARGTNLKLSYAVRDCMAILWPFCASKVTTELLLECFGACLRLCKINEPDEHIVAVLVTVINAFHRSLSVSTSKKKIFSSFTQTHLEDWLSSWNRLSSSPVHSTLSECLYNAGAECILNLDVLRDNKTESTLFNALETIPAELVIPILPNLFSSHIHALKRNRGAIFGQGSNQKLDSLDEFRKFSLRFFALCQPILNKAAERGEAWKTKTLLLDVIKDENLFTAGQLEAEKLFNGIVNTALMELAFDHEDTLGPTIRCLGSIARIDYRLIENVLPDIISQLLLVPNTTTAALDLLEVILQYHVKTRTVTIYIETLMAIHFGKTPTTDDQNFYGRICKSAGLHPVHLDRLGKCVHEFLPLNQTINAVRSTAEKMQSLWDRYSRCNDDTGPRKKRKTDNGSSEGESAYEVAFALSTAATFAYVILSSFSVNSVPKESQQELGMLLNDFSSRVLHLLSKMFKDFTRNSGTLSWTDEVVVLANLRLRYGLSLQSSHNLPISIECSSKLIQRMSESIETISLPELRLEILRTLFKNTLEGRQSSVLDLTLNILETAGISNKFSIVHMVLQRWLPLMDSKASKTQLERLVIVFMNLQRQSEDFTGDLLMPALYSAEFWELSNIRVAFMTLIEQATVVTNSWENATPLQRQLVLAVYDTLLFVPTEYLSRSLKDSLVERTIVLEKVVNTSDTQLMRSLRAFIARILSSTDYSDRPSELYSYFLHVHQHLTEAPETTRLVVLLQKSIIKSGSSAELLHLIQYYSDKLQQTPSLWSDSWARSFNAIVESMLKDHPSKNFSDPVQNALKELCEALHNFLFPSLVELINNPSASKIISAKGLLEGWRHVLKLRRWLCLHGGIPTLGEQVTKLFPFVGSGDTGAVVFGVLLEEFDHCAPSVRDKRLEVVIAAYVLLAQSIEDLSSIDESISLMCPTLSPDTFKYALKLVVESLRCAREDETKSLVRLLLILLQDSPQNTFNIVQNSLTESINIFNDREVFSGGARHSALQLLSHRCRERPGTLRQLDVSGIWLFITKLCSGAELHEQTTSVKTFHYIVSITSALVRLRRDLVLLSIPHLGLTLRRLIQSMRCPRPNLGPKQNAIVSRGLPSWINAQGPLGVEESKALSRLLEALTTKTVIKRLTTSTAAVQKAESLAKPFSKHAAYVIKAYVEVLNDPLCVLTVGVRKELQPGLYALCGMMNDFSRDALMLSASDAGEKTVVKALWREYEKQRYVGKG